MSSLKPNEFPTFFPESHSDWRKIYESAILFGQTAIFCSSDPAGNEIFYYKVHECESVSFRNGILAAFELLEVLYFLHRKSTCFNKNTATGQDKLCLFLNTHFTYK